jgi:hypothetical protein
VAADEFADGFLRNHVQADGRLVEKQHLGLVQQRGDEFHLHAFAEGKFAHADVELVLDGEQFGHFGDGALEAVGGECRKFWRSVPAIRARANPTKAGFSGRAPARTGGGSRHARSHGV